MYQREKFAFALLSLRPTLDARAGDYTVSDDGSGPRINSWNRPDLIPPTQQEIESVDTDQFYDGPESVTPRQARLALLGAGLLNQVEAMVEQSGGATKITWEYATEINRQDPLITGIGNALGLTEEQINALFINASSL